MDQILKNEILPPLLFFVAFSVVFVFLEVLLVFVLNGLGRKYWEFVIDVVIRSQVHYGKAIRYALVFVLAAILAAVILFTPLIDILVRGSGEMRLFALLLALVMALFYFVTIRKTARMKLERDVYRIVFFLVSIALFILILSIAERSYGDYVRYVDANFINPTVETVGGVLENQERDRLLVQFREMNAKGLCVIRDYTQSKEVGLKNFVWIMDEPSLAFGAARPDPAKDPKGYLRGKACSDGKDTFLLTEWGSWYWVIQ
jgi:hypothetical protein